MLKPLFDNYKITEVYLIRKSIAVILIYLENLIKYPHSNLFVGDAFWYKIYILVNVVVSRVKI